MSKLLQLRGGTTTEHASFTGALREVTVDTTKDTLVIHDGATVGGFPLPRTDADIRAAVEAATDSNVFTDADHSKLNAIEASATADQTDAEIRAAVEAATDSNVFTDADHTKLNGIETAATADQTAAEIRAAVEAATDSNVFTDADHTKLNGIEAAATADQTAAEILTAIKTVDGASSGLDADLLDGQQGSYYTSYADTAVSNLVAAAPATLDTLNELAAALGDDPNFATTVTNSIATKLPLAGGTMTGTLSTPALNISGTQVISGARDISNVGTVTATNFVGNGASLTNLPSSPFAPTFNPLATPNSSLTSSGTWTKPALSATSWVTIWMIGGGGGGNVDASWGTGGAGAHSALFSALAGALPASIAFTVGAGGVGNNAGGNTSCTISGVTYTANGGGVSILGSTATAVTQGTPIYNIPYNGLSPFDFPYDYNSARGGNAPIANNGLGSIFGGAGGGSSYNGSSYNGGVSTYAGNGGNTTGSSCTNGQAGGGGAGGRMSGAGCSGGAGFVKIYYG